MTLSQRGVTSVIGVILLVAVVVIVSAVIGSLVLGFTTTLTEPAPNVVDTAGEFTVAPAGETAGSNQLVRITHRGGDPVPVEDIEIVIRASGPNNDLPAEARLVNLPAVSSELMNENLEDPNNIIDNGDSTKNNIIISSDSNVWSADKTIQFRINTGGADFREGKSPNADKLEVIIVHTPSNAVISEQMFIPQ